MNHQSFRNDLSDYVLSGHALLHVPATETARFLEEIKTLAEFLPDGGRQVYVWSQAVRWRKARPWPCAGSRP